MMDSDQPKKPIGYQAIQRKDNQRAEFRCSTVKNPLPGYSLGSRKYPMAKDNRRNDGNQGGKERQGY